LRSDYSKQRDRLWDSSSLVQRDCCRKLQAYSNWDERVFDSLGDGDLQLPRFHNISQPDHG
jgi:hypothetical protein